MSGLRSSRIEHKTVVKVDPFKPADEQEGLMNRWHPDIPTYVMVKPGEIFKVECHDWTGGQIVNSDDADDIQNVDLTKIHNLSGPIGVEGAKPGDVLVVDILDVVPFQDQMWGYTGVFVSAR
jgi:formamidase